MKYLSTFLLLFLTYICMCQTLPIENFSQYPQTQIENDHVTMKLFLPDPEKGLYRATRFDWSGIIGSLKYKDHEYFGYWKNTHDPKIHEDLTGPAESYNDSGPGFDEAGPGGKFIRIGIGVIEKPDNKPFEIFKTYDIVDHGIWDVEKGKDWIEFKQTLESDIGYGYVYTKRIQLKTDGPGFIMTHVLENTGAKTIKTDQYNHNFFMIDGQLSGPAIHVEFPYDISTENDLRDAMEIKGKDLRFIKDFAKGESIWMEFKGYGNAVDDHHVAVKNEKTGAGVRFRVDKPLYKMVFWACQTTYCPENFIMIHVEPGKTDKWTSEYTLFVE